MFSFTPGSGENLKFPHTKLGITDIEEKVEKRCRCVAGGKGRAIEVTKRSNLCIFIKTKYYYID